MARELVSALLIATLFAVSLLNAHHLDRLADGLEEEIRLSEEYAEKGELETAKAHVLNSYQRWLDNKGYTYAVMHHEDVDAVAESFCAVLEAIPQDELDSLRASYARLYYYLETVGESEHISIKSVF